MSVNENVSKNLNFMIELDGKSKAFLGEIDFTENMISQDVENKVNIKLSLRKQTYKKIYKNSQYNSLYTCPNEKDPFLSRNKEIFNYKMKSLDLESIMIKEYELEGLNSNILISSDDKKFLYKIKLQYHNQIQIIRDNIYTLLKSTTDITCLYLILEILIENRIVQINNINVNERIYDLDIINELLSKLNSLKSNGLSINFNDEMECCKDFIKDSLNIHENEINEELILNWIFTRFFYLITILLNDLFLDYTNYLKTSSYNDNITLINNISKIIINLIYLLNDFSQSK